MKLSDMLKKKKNSPEEIRTPENQEDGEMPGTNNFANIDLQSHLDDMDGELEQEQKISPELSNEEKLNREIEEWNNKYLRLYAEFDNFKRRSVKERMELIQTAGKDIIVELLPVLDDFERAAKAVQSAKDVESVKEGILLIQNKLKNILTQKGLKEMESIGKTFDADIHEAITSIPAPSDEMKGKIVDELEKGYFLNSKAIRFAKVVIGS